MDTHVSSPIPDTHFAHKITVLLHTRGRSFLLVHTTYKIGTFQRKPAKSHRRHNCGLRGSAYAHYTRAYLTSTVLATLASLLFLNTAQLPTSSHHSLTTKHTLTHVPKILLAKKKTKKKLDQSLLQGDTRHIYNADKPHRSSDKPHQAS